MTIGKPGKFLSSRTLRESLAQHWDGSRKRKRRNSSTSAKARRASIERRLQSQTLEPRQLLAGPELVGIQPNTGQLIRGATSIENAPIFGTSVLQTAPNELTFRFDDNSSIDAATLVNPISPQDDTIRPLGLSITRAGSDGAFETATAITDFGTGGNTEVEFLASTDLPGVEGNGTRVFITAVNRPLTTAPVVISSVDPNLKIVRIQLNTNPTRPAQVRDLVVALENSAANTIVRANQLTGNAVDPIGGALPAGGLALTLDGANAARATTDLGLGKTTQLRIVADQSGEAGTRLRVVLTSQNFGGPGAPIVSITNQTVNVRLNSSPGNQSTIGQLVTALNGNPTVAGLITASLQRGNPNDIIGGRLTPTPGSNELVLPLTGATDTVVTPGFIGLGNRPNEVVFRFAEPLPEDTYQIEIYGSGERALRNTRGEAFNDGVDEAYQFSINTPPRVLAVVPEPVRRVSGRLISEPNIVEVYFTADVLSSGTQAGSVLNPNYYTAVYTQDTVTSEDDRSIRPLRVESISGRNDAVRLVFESPFSRLPDPNNAGSFVPGAVRLRVGNESLLPKQLPSQNVTPTAAILEAGDSIFADASQAGPYQVTGFTGDQSRTTGIRLTGGRIENTTPYDLQFPGGTDYEGVRNVRPDDPTRNERIVPLGVWKKDGDTEAGISTIYYNFPDEFQGDDLNTQTVDLDKTYLSSITPEQRERVREVAALFSEYLGVQFVEVGQDAAAAISGPNFAGANGPVFSIAVGELEGANAANLVGVRSGAGGITVASRELDDLGNTFIRNSVNTQANNNQLIILDAQDFDASTDDFTGGEFFRGVFLGIGQLLGYGNADHLPQPITQAAGGVLDPANVPVQDGQPATTDDLLAPNEAIFPSPADIVNGQYLYRPESNDIDLYEFTLASAGTINISTIAERLSSSSLLDTMLRLYRIEDGRPIEVAANDDYFSNDSMIELNVQPGKYVVGVSASGNDRYDPIISGTGIGGVSQGDYELAMTFTPSTTQSITDADGLQLDGDADGEAGGLFQYWFEPNDPNTTLYVDNTGGTNQGTAGSITAPFRTLNQAFQTVESRRNSTNPVAVVRVVGEGTYRIGRNQNNSPLTNGELTTIDVPKDVNLVLDAGVRFEMSGSRFGVGSTTTGVDRSGSTLQILGTPDNPVELVGVGSSNPGTWGGIDLRGDLDFADDSRTHLEDEGIFLNHIQYADIRGGGGTVTVDGVPRVVASIELASTRATIINNSITQSADAAIAATPNTFLETRFDEARYQNQAGNGDFFTSDFVRVGPHIRGNNVINNTYNGLLIRIETPAGGDTEKLTINARFDDTDIVHILTENLLIEGTPGGPLGIADRPSVSFTRTIATVNTTNNRAGDIPQGSYGYRLTNVTTDGFETVASDPTDAVALTATGAIRLTGLPTVSSSDGFSGRRLYRAPVLGNNVDGTPIYGDFNRVARLNTSDTTFTDKSLSGTVQINDALIGPDGLAFTGRLDPGLTIDPGTIVKLEGARIDVTFGARLFAEGTANDPIVLTSLNDRRYGTGGTFNTNGQFVDSNPGAATSFQPGDWSGIYAAFGADASFDHAVIAGGGGTSSIEGGFASFNVIEAHQSDLRIANSRFENNANGRGFLNDSTNDINNPNDPREQRVNRVSNATGTVFVRGSQPTIINNTFVGGSGPTLTFDVNSLTWQEQTDLGRSTGPVDAMTLRGNSGPLVKGNQIDGGLAGMEIRGGVIATEVVWDDTDIVHIVRDMIEVPNQHIYGGLRLESDARASLVVKFDTLGDTPEQTLFITGATGDTLPADLPLPGDADFNAVGTLLEPGTVTFAAGIDADVVVGDDFISITITETVAGSFTDQPFDGLQFSPEFSLGAFENATVDRVATTLQGFGPANLTFINGSLFLNTSGLDYQPGDVIRIRTNEIFPIPDVPFQPDPLLRREAGIVVGGNLYTAEDQFIGIADRIGGSLQVIGQPDFPVVLTSIADDAVGAGFTPDGRANLDTDGNGIVADFRNADTNSSTLANNPSGWHGIVIREAASDSNVAITSENEPSNVGRSDTNATASSAQYLGEVAPNRKSGDENRRIGLIVDGDISSPSDVDVYSFTAAAGTQVWIDIDRTDLSLDTIIELVNSNGQTLALSDDAMAEAQLIEELLQLDPANPNSVVRRAELNRLIGSRTGRGAQAIDADSIFGLATGQVDAGAGLVAFQDQYSTNARDAGLRVILPGIAGTRTLYHVRVRSSISPTSKSTLTSDEKNRMVVGDTSNVADDETTLQNQTGGLRRGLTQGSYQMQIRIEEQDVHAGTQINYSDVLYANKGVQVIGGPLHGPLTGEDFENNADRDGVAGTTNNTLAGAQRLGLYDTQFVNGVGLAANEVVNPDGSITIVRDGIDLVLDNPAGPLGSDRLAKNISGFIDGTADVDWYEFEINYSQLTLDGAERYLSTIFDLDYADGLGRADLALHVFNEAGELVLIGGDSNIADDIALPGTGGASDLSRGSFGSADPFIGSAELPEGIYYVAVSNQGQVPAMLDQFNNRNATNPLIRLEPIDSTRRIAEEGFANQGTPGLYTQVFQGPTTPVLFDNDSIVDYTLDDVFLYVNSGTQLFLVNPFTGARYANLGDFSGREIRDVAFAANGELFGYTRYLNGNVGDDTWQYVRINTVNGNIEAVLSTGAGIGTFHDQDFETPPAAQILDQDSNAGLSVEAITIRSRNGNETGFFVANRPGFLGGAGTQGLQYLTNILYAFDDQTGLATGPNFNLTLANAGAGTDIREIGFIDTAAPTDAAGNPVNLNNVLGLTDATVVGPGGQGTPRIFDGDTFTLFDGTNFVTFEFNQGSTLVTTSPATIANGTLLRVQVPGRGLVTFELTNSDTPTTPGNVLVKINRNASATTFNQTLAAAIQGQGLAVSAEGTQLALPTASSVELVPPAGTTVTGLTLGGNRTVQPGNTEIKLLPTDTAEVLGQRIVQAVQAANQVGDLDNVSATARDRSVLFTAIIQQVTTAGNGVRAGGQPNGGLITGIETVGNSLYAVSNAGGLYRVDPGSINRLGSNLNVGNFINTATDLIGLNFTGLRAGPNSVQGGKFSNLLFATTANGTIYAFNTAGELQNVFAGGQSSIQTGIGNAQGLDFATLDYNLWHVTDDRESDPGHGINEAFHGGRPEQPDGSSTSTNNNSLAFKYTAGQFNNLYRNGEAPARNINTPGENVRQDNQAVQNTYNFPGGARGTVQSNAFSLDGYAAADMPTMYFNYFLATDGFDQDDDIPGGDADLFDEDRDTLRVYVIDSQGVEHLVATNNESRGTGRFDDEFDDPARTGIYNDNIDVDVQQLYDNTGTWRQARVPLGVFAGQAGLSLRIEFSTAGTTTTRSAEIRTVAGSELSDGQTFQIGGESFAINLSPTVVFPSGQTLATLYTDPAAIASFTIDGQTYVLNDGTRVLPAGAISIDLTPPLNGLTSGDISQIVADSFDRDLALSRIVPSGTEIELFYQDNPVPADFDPQIYYNQNPDKLVTVYLGGIEYVLLDGDTDREGLTLPFNIQLQAPRVGVDVLLFHNLLNPTQDPITDVAGLTNADIAQVLGFITGNLNFGEVDSTIDYSQLVPSNAVLDTFYSNPANKFVVTIDDVEYVLLNSTRTAGPGQIPVLLGSNLLQADIPGALQQAVEANTGVNRPVFGVVSNFNFSDRSDPIDPFGNPAPAGADGRNDLTFQATPLPYNGGGLVIDGRGTLGTISTTAVTNRDDVDLVSVQLSAGTSLTIRSTADQPGVRNAIRFFDADGVELANPGGGTLAVFNDAMNTYTLTAPDDGLYFIGISGPENRTYDPRIQGTTDAAQTGGYALRISIEERLNVQAIGSTVEFNGINNITVGANSGLATRGQEPLDGLPVNVSRSATAVEVAHAVQTAVANRFYNGDTSLIPIGGSLLRLPGLVDPTTLGPFISTAQRYGDRFGGNFQGGAANNDSEGAYIDDIIIGFAERGELVTSSDPIDPDAAFVDFGDTALTTPNETRRLTNSGGYQLEIRDASEYIASGFVSRAEPNLVDARFRTFDTNDRLSSTGVSLITRPASEILDGSTFTITGGNNRVTFEFNVLDGDGRNNGIAANANRIEIRLPAEATAQQVADAVITQVNSSNVQRVLGVVANRSNLTKAGSSTDVPDRNVVLIGADSISTSAFGADAFVSTSQGDLRGDSNRDRTEQGVIMVENSRFLFNQEDGLQISRAASAGVISSNDGDRTPSILPAVRNFDQINTENLVPGVVVRNNTFAFNQQIGVDIVGLENGGAAIQNPVGFDRIINNTLMGGSITQSANLGSQVFAGKFFPMGGVSFADSVVQNTADLGPDVEQSFADFEAALGSPDCQGISATDPANGQFTLSLGSGGQVTFVFEDNLLTGSSSNPGQFNGTGDGIADLAIFESGIPERVQVEVSRDNVVFFNVGTVFGLDNTVDLDAYGFGRNDRFSYVRLTDLSPAGSFNFGAAGADIDAVGALSTVLRDRFTPGEIGIHVSDNAAPTLLNNIVSNFDVGLLIAPPPPVATGLVDRSSNLTVIGGTTFFRNEQNTVIAGANGVGQKPLFIGEFNSVFVDPFNLIFTPQARTEIIDSGVGSILERSSLATLRNSIGVPPNPVLAPQFDSNGQLRVDDPTFNGTSGTGTNSFVDRGAQERTDNEGPRFVLTSPRGEDLIFNGNVDGFGRSVTRGTIYDSFEIQLIDGIRPADSGFGTGINDLTVTSANFLVTRLIAGSNQVQPLQEGRDYRFAYEPADNMIRITPIAGIWTDDSVYTIEFLGGQADSVDGYTAVIQAQPGINYGDGQKTFIDGRVLETEMGIQLSVPRDALTLTDPITGASQSIIGEQTVTVSDGVNPEVTFEFVTDVTNIPGPDNRLPFTGNFAVRLPPTASPQLVTRLLAREINRVAGLGLLDIEAVFLNETDLGQTGRLQLLGGNAVGGNEGAYVRLDDVSIFRQVNQELDVQLLIQRDDIFGDPTLTNFDGEQITVFDGDNEVLFEFDSDGLLGVISPDVNRVVVPIQDDTSPRQIVQALIAGFNQAGLEVNAFGASGTFRIRGTNGPISVSSPTGGALVTGNSQIGVSPGFGISIPTENGVVSQGVQDGQTFTIGRGLSNPVTFELNFDGVQNDPNAVPVTVLGGGFDTPPDTLANAIVAAVRGVFPSLNPTNVGGGRVTLGDEADIQLNTSGTFLDQTGSAGDGASQAVVIRYNDDASTVASSFADAANAAGIDATLTDTRVLLRTSTLPQGDTIVTEFISDRAGNRLQPASEQVGSRVEIFVGSLFDYGDASKRTPDGGTYATTIQRNGPRHQIVDNLYMGSTVTADVNGVNDDSDVDDGITQLGTLQPGFSTQFEFSMNQIPGTNNHVQASTPFYLDAWFDWDGDGLFEENAGEVTRYGSAGTGLRVIRDDVLNTLIIQVPSTANLGTVQSRFRLSYEAGLGPNGLATAGEVEDYTFQIVNNPFQSPRISEDVNDSGGVTPLDALIIINLLNQNNGPINLNNVPPGLTLPPFPDVNGDGSITAVDALRVINRLNASPQSGEPLIAAGEPIIAAGEPLLADGEPLVSSSTMYQTVSTGVMATPSTILFDPTKTSTNFDRERETSDDRSRPQVAVERPDVTTNKTSVFDSPAEMQLDSIVDSLANDRQAAKAEQSDDGLSAIDEIFASL